MGSLGKSKQTYWNNNRFKGDLWNNEKNSLNKKFEKKSSQR